MVPKWIQSQVWGSYRAGQCDDMNPSGSWMIAATRAICAVAVREGVLTNAQAIVRIGKEIDLFSKNVRTPQTRLVNLRGTDHRGEHVYIGRGSPFGNPYSHNPDTKFKTIQVPTRDRAIALYRVWINSDEEIEDWPKPTDAQIMSLRGKALGCYCTPLPCHGDVLLDYIDADDSVSVDVSGVSPSLGNAREASSNVHHDEDSGGGTDLRRGAVLIGSENPEVQSGKLTGSKVECPPKEATDEKGHQAGTADPVPLTSTGLSPPLRWVGGKRWLVEHLVPKIIEHKPALYVEPFLGAGAIALALPKTIPMLLNDYSEPLMNLWRCIQRTPNIVAAMARACLENLGNTRDGYLLARDHFNILDAVVDADGPPMEALERAALMLYLNSTSYNGVWRENKRGGYNVPFGDVKNPAICDVDELAAISDHLGAANLLNMSYEDVFDLLVPAGTVIYADPPYHSGFDDYIAGGFSDELHERLADRLFDLANAGAVVYTTNADTELIRRLYKNANHMDVVMESRNVAQKTSSRKAVSCLLIEI